MEGSHNLPRIKRKYIVSVPHNTESLWLALCTHIYTYTYTYTELNVSICMRATRVPLSICPEIHSARYYSEAFNFGITRSTELRQLIPCRLLDQAFSICSPRITYVSWPCQFPRDSANWSPGVMRTGNNARERSST